MRFRFCTAVLVFQIAILTTAFADSRIPGPAPRVMVDRAVKECFASTVRATGYVVPRATSVVMFNAPGFKISEVTAHPGDSVKELEQVAVAVPISGTRVASVSDSPVAQEHVPILASAAGTILRSSARVGMVTSEKDEPLFVLATDGEMELLVDIASVHVLEIAAGQTAHITIDDGRSLGGHVRLVPVEINRLSQIGQARISIDGSNGLEMGRFVHVAIDASRSCGLGVPRAALMHDIGGVRLQIVHGDMIETHVVKLGLLSEVDAEIVEGVEEGDLVVSDAGTSLRDGDKVRPVSVNLEEMR
jgi:multidrug efflux pump subunit AcrA (membrane-fusion protein)